MRRFFQSRPSAAGPGVSTAVMEGVAAEEQKAAAEEPGIEAELIRYLPRFSRMSKQLKQTSEQIESSVVEVCGSFYGIAERAKETVARTAGFLVQEGDQQTGKRSFEELIENCGGTLVRILNATEEASQLSRRAIERIQQMDASSQKISAALAKLEQIAKGNKMLALNARIEAAHAGEQGVGFAVVAGEVLSQAEKSQVVADQVYGLIADLRSLAGSALVDLQQMNDQDHKRLDQSKQEVDASLKELQAAHGEMKKMLTGMSEDGALLANDIGAAVRGLQFQDRTSQRIAHVIEDLDALHAKLTDRFGVVSDDASAAEEEISAYTMYEEREVAGIQGAESAQGDVELF
jgi:methyl-accepting chemotaxis protein